MAWNRKAAGFLAAVLLVALSAMPVSASMTTQKEVKVKLADGGAEVADARVTVLCHTDGAQYTLDYDGESYTASLTIGIINEYTFRLTADHSDYMEVVHEFALRPTSSSIITVEMENHAACTVAVSAADQYGEPVENVSVTVEGQSALTGQDGGCTIKLLRGTAPVPAVVLPPDGYRHAGGEVVDISGSTAALSLPLERDPVPAVTLDLTGQYTQVSAGSGGRPRLTGRDADSGALYNNYPVDSDARIEVCGSGTLSVSGYVGTIYTADNTSITLLIGDVTLHTEASNFIKIMDLNSEVGLTGAGHRDLGPVSTSAHIYTIGEGSASFVGDYRGQTNIVGASVAVSSGVRLGDSYSGTGTDLSGGYLTLQGGATVEGDITVHGGAVLDLTGVTASNPVSFGPGVTLLLEDRAVVRAPDSATSLPALLDLVPGAALRLDSDGSTAVLQTEGGTDYALTSDGGNLILAPAGSTPDSGSGTTGGTSAPARVSSGSVYMAAAPPKKTALETEQADLLWSGAGPLSITVPAPANRLGFLKGQILPGHTTELLADIPREQLLVHSRDRGVSVIVKETYLSSLSDGEYTLRMLFIDSFADIVLTVDRDGDRNVQPPEWSQNPDSINFNPDTGR